MAYLVPLWVAVFEVGMRLFTRDELQRKDIDTIKRQLRWKLGGYGVAIKHLLPTVLFRGVKCLERPTTKGRISYPPVQFVTELGRLNRAHQAMFYCSKAAPSVFFEIHARQGDCIALASWKLHETLWFHSVGYHPDALGRLGAPVDGPRAQLVNPIPRETPSNEKMRRALSLAFTEDVKPGDEYRYKLTIAINENLFDGASPLPDDLPNGPRNNRAAGTVYPAMKLRGVADNVAIWPEFVDAYMQLQLVQWVCVEEADQERSLYTVRHLATSREFPGGNLIWDETPMEARHGRGTIALENGRWVQRDGNGIPYDIH